MRRISLLFFWKINCEIYFKRFKTDNHAIFYSFKSEQIRITRLHPTVRVHATPFKEKYADVYYDQIKSIVNYKNFGVQFSVLRF